LSSCKKEVIVPNDTIPNLTILKYVAPGAWQQLLNNKTLTVDIPVSEIDRDTFENDEVAVSISVGDNDTYDKVPYVYNTQSYSYQIRPGFLTLYIQTSGDTNTVPIRPTVTTRVKIVLITSSL
ncbi:MAG: hypothetical protein MUP99_04210, partial [Pedobacter sp.]|nr:hypothetical protein [Pedobacter sp.]